MWEAWWCKRDKEKEGKLQPSHLLEDNYITALNSDISTPSVCPEGA